MRAGIETWDINRLHWTWQKNYGVFGMKCWILNWAGRELECLWKAIGPTMELGCWNLGWVVFWLELKMERTRDESLSCNLIAWSWDLMWRRIWERILEGGVVKTWTMSHGPISSFQDLLPSFIQVHLRSRFLHRTLTRSFKVALSF